MTNRGWRQYLPELEKSADMAVSQLFDVSSIITLLENNTVFHRGMPAATTSSSSMAR